MSTDFGFHSYLNQLKISAPAPGRLAMFDLDRTLIAGYSFHAFVFERTRRGMVSTKGLAGQIRQVVEYGLQRIEFKQLLQQVAVELQGLDSGEVMTFAQDVFKKHLQASLYREARQLVEAHRRLGHRLVMVTSATRFQAQPVADFLGFDEICCTELGERNGRLTGRLRGKPCFSEGKANAGRRVARRNGQSLLDAWFYTDSADDLPLLDAVGIPVVVNAQSQLAALAYDRRWPALTFRSRRAPSIEGAIRYGMVCQGLIGSALAGAATYARTLSPREARTQLSSAADVIRSGRSVAIAPEGTRSNNEELGAFKRGAFVLARKAGVPVVPVVLHNSGDVLPKGKLCINPATVRVTVLPPIKLHDCSRHDFTARINSLGQKYREALAG